MPLPVKKVIKYLAGRLVQARDEKGMTQLEVCHLLGIKQSKLSKLENGELEINAFMIYYFADLYSKEYSYFYPPVVKEKPKEFDSGV